VLSLELLPSTDDLQHCMASMTGDNRLDYSRAAPAPLKAGRVARKSAVPTRTRKEE
jgi:hypothetical protein